jgi:uncharacterized membrane protein YjgN (DUF898 family)
MSDFIQPFHNFRGSHAMSANAANPAFPSFPKSTAGLSADAQPRAQTDMPAQDTQRHPVRFTGSGSEYFRIWIVNLLLILVTFTLYYPWAKVRKLRYFYGNTEVAGHALDFHGDPKRMLRGYLLVGALFLVYNFSFRVSPTAALIALAIMAGIWPVLFRTSQRFRLANTSWRGLRFSFSGDVAGAYKALMPAFVPAILMFLVLALLGLDLSGEAAAPQAVDRAQMAQFGLWFGGVTIVSLLATPLMWWALKRYQHANYGIAQVRASFQASVGSFYKVSLKAFGLFLLMLLGLGAVVALSAGAALMTSMASPVMGVLIGVLVVFFYIAVFVLLHPYVVARFQNLIWNQTHSHAIGFESTLRARSLLWMNVKNWLLILLTLGLYWPFAAVATARLRLQAVTVLAHQNLDELLAAERHRMKDATGDVAADVFGVDLGM